MSGIERLLRKYTKKPPFAPHLLIGSGGTFTSLAEMIMVQKGQFGLPMRGYTVTARRSQPPARPPAQDVAPCSARRAGSVPDRADIIVAGLAVVDRVMARFKVNLLQVHNRGVRDGLLLTMIDESLAKTSADPVERETAIERFAVACSGELVHGRHVAKLAGDDLFAIGRAASHGLRPIAGLSRRRPACRTSAT